MDFSSPYQFHGEDSFRITHKVNRKKKEIIFSSKKSHQKQLKK